jgi:hypothetical protein
MGKMPEIEKGSVTIDSDRADSQRLCFSGGKIIIAGYGVNKISEIS